MHDWQVAIDQCGIGAQERSNLQRHGGWRDVGEMLANEVLDLTWVLIRNQSKVEFCRGVRRNHSFHAVPMVTSGDSTHTQRRSNRGALVERKTALTPIFFSFCIGKNFFVRRSGARHIRAFFRRPLPDAIVKTGYRDTTISIVQPGDHFTECLQRVVYRTAKITGVQVGFCTVQLDFKTETAA